MISWVQYRECIGRWEQRVKIGGYNWSLKRNNPGGKK